MDNHEAATQKERLEKYDTFNKQLESLDAAIEVLTELATHAGVELRELRFNRPATPQEREEEITSDNKGYVKFITRFGKDVPVHLLSDSLPADAIIKAVQLALKRSYVDIKQERDTL